MNLDWEITHYCEMGFAVNMVAAKLLTNGISSLYPNTQPNIDPEDWFVVHPLKPEDEEYTIQDHDLDLYVSVPKPLLEDPAFNLTDWYRQYVDHLGIYQQQYETLHCQLYQDDSSTEYEMAVEELDNLGVEFESDSGDAASSDPDDMPGLSPVSDSEDEGEGEDSFQPRATLLSNDAEEGDTCEQDESAQLLDDSDEDTVLKRVVRVLT